MASLTMNEWIDKIDKTIGKDWSTARSRLYIAAELTVLTQACERLQKELDFERAVNKRVDEIVKELLSTKMDKCYVITGPAS